MAAVCGSPESWIVEKILGTGGFGQVSLWRNKVTNETLAVKKCRLGSDPLVITAKHKERWNLEVEIMQKLKHPNVVAALPVPPQLAAASDEMPVLAMEYCSRGDLRKILNRPENCCGLSETQVRRLTRDASSALAYLHSRRIIHRDLKPENVMVQDVRGKLVYKLTDLGYAKELDQMSVCTSFVGTLQYLAPELFMSQEYTCTVDYWSLGLVAHECMVGARPFLPNMAPAEWMKHVCRKRPTDVCVYTTRDGAIQFSEHIFKENHLSEPFVAHMERWLREMLEWKPHKRGIDSSGGTRRFVTHSMLEDILNRKIVHCFVVGTGELRSYEIETGTRVRHVLLWLARDVGASSEEDFECVSLGGDVVDDDRAAVDLHYDDPVDDEERICYIFDRNMVYEMDRIRYPDLRLVTEILEEESSSTMENWLRVWAHSLHFLSMEMKLHKRFLRANEVYRKHLNAINSSVFHACRKMLSEMNGLKAKLEFYQECLNADKKAYDQANRMHGLSSHQLESCLYARSEDIVRLVDVQQDAVTQQELTVNTIRLPVDEDDDDDDMEEMYERASKMYAAFRIEARSTGVLKGRGEMADVISQCIRQRVARTKRHLFRLQKNQDCKRLIVRVLTTIAQIASTIRNVNRKLASLQIDRQMLIWKAFNTLMTKQDSSISMPQPSCSGENYEPVSLKSIVNKVSEDSLKTIKQNHDLRSKWCTQFASLNTVRNETLNWDFMDEIKRPN